MHIKLYRFRRIWKIILIGVPVCVLLFATLFDPIDTIYNANIYSDVITIKTIDETSSSLTLNNADLTDADSDRSLRTHYSGELKISPGVTVKFEKVTNNSLMITLTADPDSTSGAVNLPGADTIDFHTKGVTEILIDSLSERVANGNTPYFALNGKLKVGDDYSVVNSGMKPRLLRSGEISMVGLSRYISGTFPAKTLEVHTGEIVSFSDDKCYGFVTIGENNNLLASYRTKSHTAQIFKPGPKESITTYNVGATKFERIAGANLFQFLSILITIVLAVLQLIDVLCSLFSRLK